MKTLRLAGFAWMLVLAAANADAQHPKPTTPAEPEGPPPPAEERLHEAWSYLLPEEQEQAAMYMRDALKHLDTFQQSLVDFALKLEPRDASALPAEPEAPYYDPATHAPRQPIARTRLAPDDPRAIAQRESMFANVPKSGLASAWRYDWATREIERTSDERDPSRIFFNALAGFPPDLDLGIALIERALDDGAEQKALTAFAHAYTDRSGNVYPGVTLYDAWSSGIEMEMPNVDVLGVIHDLANDWKTWTAPVSDSKHKALYGKVVEYYKRAKQHRGLRSALAATFFTGSARLRDGYQANCDRLHSWWDELSSTPEDLRKELPPSAKWAVFLEKWSERIDNDAKLTQRGIARRATLDADAGRVRATAITIVKELGALDRKERPQPKPPPEDTNK